jgi:L-alanine-DL-glutamate epimerase-like enolase superfamily enzyme
VCAIEMALWDIAGKVYNCPVYQMLGGQWRDKVHIYADTTESDVIPSSRLACGKLRVN